MNTTIKSSWPSVNSFNNFSYIILKYDSVREENVLQLHETHVDFLKYYIILNIVLNIKKDKKLKVCQLYLN